MQRLRSMRNPPVSPKTSNPLRFGILGAARIGADALFTPAKSHPDVVVTVVACRDETRGAQYAQTYGIPKLYSGPQCYKDLVEDANIDAVYIPLPNGLHYEWTMRAIDAGKHVLVEKPMADSADEVRRMFAFAEKKGVIILEAIHFTFHPATQRVKEIVDSGELGEMTSIRGEFAVPSLLSPLLFMKDDIRYSYDLGGGCTMDMGVYPLAAILYFTGTEPAAVEVAHAKANGVPSDATRVDRSMNVTYSLRSAVVGESFADFQMPGWGPFGLIPRMPKLSVVIKFTGGELEYFNFLLPGAYHSITVKPSSGRTRTEKVYKHPNGQGEVWWSTYRYQLEAFVDKIRGRTPQYWTDPQTTISQVENIEKIYAKAGMPPRITSTYTPPESASA